MTDPNANPVTHSVLHPVTRHRKITRPATILLVALGLYLWSQLHPKELIPWRDNYATAAAEARQTGKPLFLYFTAAWCGPCQSLKTTTWADRGVADQLAKSVPVKLDVDAPANQALTQKYHVAEIPYFVVLDKQENQVRSEAGTLSPHLFVKWFNGQIDVNALK